MALLEIERLDKIYDNGAHAVRDVSLAAAAGERLVLLGPSGCGKSTLLRLIAGLETPTGGCVRLGGVDQAAAPPWLRNVSMVFQQPNLYPHLNVADNLAFGLRRSGVPAAEARRRAAEMLRRLHLGELADRLPRTLSRGQQQRVALGRAFMRPAAVHLLDEPLTNMDPHLRDALRELILELQRQRGGTLVYVTHDHTEALLLGGRIAVMREGRLEQEGSAQEIYTRPQSLFVADFIGSPPLNRIPGASRDGVFTADGGGLRLRPPPGGPSRRLVLGVRPEHVGLGAAPDEGAICLGGEVTSYTALGREAWVQVRAGSCRLTALAPPEAIYIVGAPVEVWLRPAHCLLFDEESGMTVGTAK